MNPPFEEWVERYGPRMLATARRLLRDDAEAQDCVQDAFLAAFRNLAGFQGRSSAGTWLHRILINEALTRIRSRTRRREESIEHLLPEFDATGMRMGVEPRSPVGIESLLQSEEVRNQVRAAIDRLPARYRTILLVRDIEGYDTEEAAALLEISTGAVKTRLHRARAALKKLLEPLMFNDESPKPGLQK
jgi:RNA polymerase sigma-70 factor, ECF subfamily